MIFYFIGIAAAKVTIEVIKASSENDPAPAEKPVPKDYSPLVVSDNLVRYGQERKLYESSLPPVLKNDLVIELDILEAFIIHCSEEGSLAVLQSLILLLTIANCSKGLRDDFPQDMLPFMLHEGVNILKSEIEKSSSTYEFLKVALRACDSLKSIISTEIENPCKYASA